MLTFLAQSYPFLTQSYPPLGSSAWHTAGGIGSACSLQAAVTRTPPRAVRGTAEDSGVEEGPNQEEEEEDCCPICLDQTSV